MLFWVIVIGLALVSGGILAFYTLKGRVGEEPPAAYDLRIYRDQLKEVDRDLARGVIGEEDAERLRTEVSRRILAADARLKAGGETGGQPRAAGYAMAALAVLGVGGGAVWLYDIVGAPGYDDLPQQVRIMASDEARANRLSQEEAEARMPSTDLPPDVAPDYLELMERLRATVAERPDDVRGLALLVRNEAALGNLSAAHKAQAQLIAAKGEDATATDYGLLADLMVSAAGGYVSSDADAALRAALDRNPREPRARYYLGLFLMQVDRPDGAFRTWQTLLEESDPAAPWVPLIRSQIEEVAWRAGVEYELPAADEQPAATDAPGPTEEQVEAAGEMTPEERMTMIRGMVEGLMDRLANEGGSAEEWARLIGALSVLGETERATAIWTEAQSRFEGRPEDLAIVEEAARQAGLSE